MDCTLPGSSVHGISQARILEWVAISFSRGSSQHRNQTHISAVAFVIYSLFWALKSLLTECNPVNLGCFLFSFNYCALKIRNQIMTFLTQFPVSLRRMRVGPKVLRFWSWLCLLGDQPPSSSPSRVTSLEQKTFLWPRKFQGIWELWAGSTHLQVYIFYCLTFCLRKSQRCHLMFSLEASWF